MLRPAITAAMLGAVAAGCPWSEPLVESNRLNYALARTGLVANENVLASAWTGEPVLEGSRTCPAVVCLAARCDVSAVAWPDVGACVRGSTSGGLEISDGCLTFTAPGAARWAIEGGRCALDTGVVRLPVDEFFFTVVAAADVTARAFIVPERLAAQIANQGNMVTDGAPLPEDLGAGREVVTVVEGVGVPVDVELLRRADGTHVAFDGDVRVAADPRGGGATGATMFVDTRDGPLRAATLRAVAAEEVAALEVTIFWLVDNDDPDQRSPFGALALVHLADGTRAEVAPVRWSVVDGELAIADLYTAFSEAPSNTTPDPWRLLGETEAQRATRGPQTATLRAELGAHTVDVPLSWSRYDLPAPEPPPAPVPAPACGCASTDRTRAGPVGLLAGLIWLALRRHGPRPSIRSTHESCRPLARGLPRLLLIIHHCSPRRRGARTSLSCRVRRRPP